MRSVLLHTIVLPALFAQSTVYTIDTFAGTTWNGDKGSARSALLVQPQGLAIDNSGNVYVSDAGDHRVRRIDLSGMIETVAGTGIAGYRGDGEAAVKAQLRSPYGLAVDGAGNLVIADLGNACVRRLSTNGIIQTIAGGGTQLPAAGAVIGATRAKLNQPRDVAVDRFGNVFIADFGANFVYQITPDGMLTVIAGNGQSGPITYGAPAIYTTLSHPAGLALDPFGALYIADSGNRRVRRLQGGWLSTVTDGTGKDMEFGTPTGLACDSLGRIFVADGSGQVTVVFPNGGFTALAIAGTAVAQRNSADVYTVSGRTVLRFLGAAAEVVAGSVTGPGAGDGYNRSEWRFTSPSAIVRDDYGSVYIADTGNGRVRRLTPSGELQTVTTRIPTPVALAFDARSRLHVADRDSGTIYRVEAGSLQIVAQVENRAMRPSAMVFDPAGNLYVADEGNNLIRRIAPDGLMTIVAGGGSQTADGVALLCRLNAPAGLAFDDATDLWFTEAGTGRLRKLSDGRIITLTVTELKEPRGLRITSDGHFVVADAAGQRVIRIAPTGQWTPLAGTGDGGFSGDGELALGAMLNRPADVLALPDGTLLIADAGNNRIRRLRPTATPVDPEPPSPVTITPPAEVAMPAVQVLHGATLKFDAVAPGQIVYVTGEAIPPKPRITFDNVPTVVLAESANRLTLQIPRDLSPGVVELTVWADGKAQGKAPVDITAAAPGIVTLEGGAGQALATNQDGTQNSPTSPAARGSIVTLYVTGEGTGTPAVSADIAGHTADVIWSGAAPGLPGLFQVNVRTPGGFSPSGIVPVVLTVGGVRTQSGVTLVSR